MIFNEEAPLSPQVSIQMLRQAQRRRQMCDFLSAADISIADVEVVTRKVPDQSVHFDPVAGKTELRIEEMEEHQLRFSHITDHGKAVFDSMDESGYLDVIAAGAALNARDRVLVRVFHFRPAPGTPCPAIFLAAIERRASAAAIARGLMTKSTHPVACAASGIWGTSALLS